MRSKIEDIVERTSNYFPLYQGIHSPQGIVDPHFHETCYFRILRTAAKLLKGYIMTPISSRYKTSNHQFATFEVLRKNNETHFSTIM